MSAGLYVRSFIGFAIQLFPCAMLLLMPFQEKDFTQGRRRAFLLLALLSIGFSLLYPLNIWKDMGHAESGNLDDNIFMLAAIAGGTALFFRLANVNSIRKISVLFIVIGYASVQFFLSNMLMDFLPLPKQEMIYNDSTLAAYLIVTAVLLPPVIFFMRRRMKNYLALLEPSEHSRLELIFLVAVLALYLVLNVLYTALWIKLRDTLQLSSVYYVPFSLFLSLLLIFTFYCTINLSVFKARSAEQALELALMRQNYKHVEENIRQQKRALHDTRQLLRSISALARDGTKETLLKYIDEAIDYTSISNTRFCANPCVNGLLAYYAGMAESQGIGFSVHAVCGHLPFSDADMTILLSNVLDNALRASAEFDEAVPGQSPEIRFMADTISDQFAVQVENRCFSVSYAKFLPKGFFAEGKNWFPAGAFQSTHGSGYGLRRMEMITEKYGGHAWFSHDADKYVFITRLMLPVKEG